MRKNASIVLKELGFKDLAEWGRHIEEHATEIVTDYRTVGLNATMKKWHIGAKRLKDLIDQAKEGPEPTKPVTAQEFAHEVLMGFHYLMMENYQLKQQIEALKLEIRGYELDENRRKVEDGQAFQAKIKRTLAESGEKGL